MHESVEKFIDDPVKVMAPITIGAAALFAVFGEAVPEQREMVMVLGGADFLFNTACWVKFARDRNRPVDIREESEAASLLVDETA